MHQWYYMKSGILGESQEGPFDEATFIKLLLAGDVGADASVSSPTRTKSKWVKAGSIPALAERINKGKVDRKVKRQEQADEKRDVALQKKKSKLAKSQQQAAEPAPAVTRPAEPPRALPPSNPYQPTPPSHQTTVIVNQQQSNTVPVLLNVFLFPGLGQLVQGRPVAGILLMFCWVCALFSILIFLIGLVLCPIVWLVALVDAAMYKG